MPSFRSLFSTVALIGIVLLFASAPLAAGSQDKDAAKAREAGLATVTVFVDATWGNRTHGAARALTEVHQSWGRHGYSLVSLEPYAENGDLVGFFVSYRLSESPEGGQR